jgi:hypothetical protein
VCCEIIGNNSIALQVIERHLNYPYYRNFMEKKLRLLTECTFGNTMTNVATKRRSVSPFPQGQEGILNENYEGRWIRRSGPAARPDLNPQVSFSGVLWVENESQL